MKSKKILTTLFGLLLISSCKTDSSVSQEKDIVSNKPIVQPEELNLSKDEEQSLYLKMLQVELRSGVLVEPDHIHMAEGVLVCSKSGMIKSCFVRTLIGDDILSSAQEVDRSIAERAWNWINYWTKDESQEKATAAIRCNYIGKKSPPYDIEDVTCHVSDPVRPDEMRFKGELAKDLFAALKGTNPSEITRAGSLVCRIIEESGREACVTRRLESGLQSDDIRELSNNSSSAIMHLLRKAALSAISQNAKDTTSAGLSRKADVSAAIFCQAPNEKDPTGSGLYRCFAKINTPN